MDILALIKELYAEKARLDEIIASLERIDQAADRVLASRARRGKKPAKKAARGTMKNTETLGG
jgi:hypothetical protein